MKKFNEYIREFYGGTDIKQKFKIQYWMCGQQFFIMVEARSADEALEQVLETFGANTI